jgi:aminopeptidase N
VDTESLAESALVDGINTARVGNAYFGKLPLARIAITQQSQWNFGQSWPGLIYLPYLAFLDSGVRHELGLERAKDFVEAVGPHELAHQWWGHLVGWNNYSDQWLSEGFAEFTAGLVLEKTGGPARARDFWSKAQKFIVETSRGSALPNCDAGPISLGWRLANFRTPSAYGAIVYSKGAYVLRMLRAMMREDRAPDPDHAFSAMMKDFVARYAGKNPTTADFQRVVEEHIVPALNATGNGKLDWFFRQWVDGTAIPRVTAKVVVKSAGGNKYELAGEVKQEGVPDDFRVLMPLYVDFGKGKVGKFGVLPLMGNRTVPVKLTIELPQKPKAVVANALGEVLTRN